MLSEGMRAAMKAGGSVASPKMVWAETVTEVLVLGEQTCLACGTRGDQLEFDGLGRPSGPFYEHRAHYRKGVQHVWPQLHACLMTQNARLLRKPESLDACPVCADCKDC